MVKVMGGSGPSRQQILERSRSSEASSNTGIIRVVVRFPKPPPSPPDPNRIPVVFLLAYDIVQQIDDFYTLCNLSRTCRTFYGLVNSNPSHRNALFDKLETQDHSKWSDERYYEDLLCRQVRQQRTHRTPGVWMYPWGRLTKNSLGEGNRTSDMVKYGGLTIEDIAQPMYLPCYGCKKFKGSTEFLPHRMDEHLILLGCRHELRLCIDCEFAKTVAYHEGQMDDESDEVAVRLTRRTRNILDSWRHFLVDMPKGYPGFRQHCQVCKATAWARVRPTKTRESRQVCEECYQKGLSSMKSRHINRRKKDTNSGDEDGEKAKEIAVVDHTKVTGFLDESSEFDTRTGGSRFDILQDHG